MKQFIRSSSTNLLRLCCLFACLAISISPALATRLSPELKTAIQSVIPDAKFRLDGAIETKTGQVYVPLSPPKPAASIVDKSGKAAGAETKSNTTNASAGSEKKPGATSAGAGSEKKPGATAAGAGSEKKPGATTSGAGSEKKPSANPASSVLDKSSKVAAASTAVQLKERSPAEGQPDAFYFSNGWCFLRILKKGNGTTVGIGAISSSFRKQLSVCKFLADLIVPENFAVPVLLKSAIGDLAITIALPPAPKNKDGAGASDQAGNQSATNKLPSATIGSGAIFIGSPATGKISMLDGTTYDKVTDFPTEGTPASMVAAEGRLYIADQGKNRVLILDPKKRQFLGQIDLPPKSAPTGLAALPNGKLIYVSESAGNNVDVIETDTGKVLLKTKVAAGPSKLAMAPNGTVVCVLNPPCSQITLITTTNQKVLGTVKVGGLPNAVAFSKDSAFAYVSNRNSNNVTVIDIAKRAAVGNIPTGLGPTGLVLTKDGDKLLVANAKDNTLSLLDLTTRTKIQDIKLPLDVDFPKSLFMMPDGQHVVVSSASTDTVGIFNLEKLEFEKQPVIGQPSDEMLWMSLD